jgi:hypothetical protein
MKKLLLLFFIAHSFYAKSPVEEYLQTHHFTPSQEVAIKIGTALAFWATISISTELMYYTSHALRKVNRAIINNSIHSVKQAWNIAMDEPVIPASGQQTQDSTVINIAKIIAYIGLAAVPIGVCYLAIS